MELNKRQWFVGWFFWSSIVWDEFRGTDSTSRYENSTNLCHFIRVILVWCPLVLLLHATVYGSAIAALTALPIYLYGGVGYVLVVGAIAFVVGLILVIKFALRRLRKCGGERLVTREAEPKGKVETPTAPTGPGFFKVLLKYFVGLKMKVCPTITFNRQMQETV